jgi:predicted TIM-barrel fold metal-dependent hydrolase
LDLFDAHLHIIDPAFPLQTNNGYEPPAFTVDDYRKASRGHGITGGAVVSGSFQGFDQNYLVDALKRLGPDFVGVTQLPADTPDTTILELHEAGVRGVRFNLHRGGSEKLNRLADFGARIHELAGWHVELYADAAELEPIRRILLSLPAVSLDHLGLTAAGRRETLLLAERGVRIKACGFGRLDFDLDTLLSDLHKANPEALMFGTDLPGTRAPRAFHAGDIERIRALFAPEDADRVLGDNARNFYRMKR